MTRDATRHLLILGSTGSIGRQALEVLPAVPDLALVGLAAGQDVAGIVEQARAYGVREVCLHEPGAASEAAAWAPELMVRAGDTGVREEMRTRLFEWALSRRTRITVTDDFIERLTGGAKSRGYRFGEW